MKAKMNQPYLQEPTEDEIRDYAYHLYEQSGCLPGRDMENWLEARDCLRLRHRSANRETRLTRQKDNLVLQH